MQVTSFNIYIPLSQSLPLMTPTSIPQSVLNMIQSMMYRFDISCVNSIWNISHQYSQGSGLNLWHEWEGSVDVFSQEQYTCSF